MYYAADSAKVNKELYTFGSGDNTKLIFKAAELIDADTLKTTVDKKSVFVAEKGNPSKNVKGVWTTSCIRSSSLKPEAMNM